LHIALTVTFASVATVAFAGSTSFAEQASDAQMQNVAQNWLSETVRRTGDWAGTADPAVREFQPIVRDQALLGWYCSVEPRGFIVVPSLKEAGPVIAYSDESDLDISAEQGLAGLLKDILKSRADYYYAVYGDLDASQPSQGPLVFDPSQKERWDRFAASARDFRPNSSLADAGQGGPLLTTIWGQNVPFNNDCPMGGGDRTAVGCLATAMAQILRYWSWPASGLGSCSYWWKGDYCGGETAPGATLGASFADPYDWANMPNDCGGGCTPEQEAALAELSFEVGVSLQMKYSACGSLSYTVAAAGALAEHFKFSPTMTYPHRLDYSAEEWFGLVQTEIDAGRVAYYDILGHAIVCDGWRDDGAGLQEFHMNYGWAGPANAWYVVDHMFCASQPGQICPIAWEHIYGGLIPKYDPELRLFDCTIDRQQNGGTVAPGDNLAVDLTIQNQGNDAAGVEVAMISSDPYVNLIAPTVAVGDVSGWGNSSNMPTPITLSVDPSCPPGHVLDIQLELSADGGYSTVTSLPILVVGEAGFEADMESGQGHWTHFANGFTAHDDWHLDTYRSHSGTTSWKVGGNGAADYEDRTDATVATPPILLPPGAVLDFWHWIDVNTTGSALTYDGGTVMIRSNGGEWSPLAPIEGYLHIIAEVDTAGIHLFCPFQPWEPCFAGTFDWRETLFDLSAYSGVVQIGFRLGADVYQTGEGWYIDDVWVGNTLAGNGTAVEPAPGWTVAFDEITSRGITTATVAASPPELPSQYNPLPVGSPLVYDVSTTATLDGPIRFAVGYDETGLSVAETSLALLHYDGAQWVDVTESIDTEANLIIGSSSSLSYFVAAERTTCCVSRVGDANGSGTEAPTIGDISTMIDAKFISESCDGLITCFVEADINQSGGISAGCDDITIGDISMLIDYLFVTGPDDYGPLNDCL
jgi:hypothetical protein